MFTLITLLTEEEEEEDGAVILRDSITKEDSPNAHQALEGLCYEHVVVGRSSQKSHIMISARNSPRYSTQNFTLRRRFIFAICSFT